MTYALLSFVNLAFRIFSYLILIEVLASWLPMLRINLPDPVYNILRAIHSITSPVLDPIRRVLPSLGGLDLSPIVALLLLEVLRSLVVGALAALT